MNQQQLYTQNLISHKIHSFEPFCDFSPPTTTKIQLQEEMTFNNDNNKEIMEINQDEMDFEFFEEILEEAEMISYEPTNPFLNQITFKIPSTSLFVTEKNKKLNLDLELQEEEEEEINFFSNKKRKINENEKFEVQNLFVGLNHQNKKRKFEKSQKELRDVKCGNFESIEHFFEEIEKQTTFSLSYI